MSSTINGINSIVNPQEDSYKTKALEQAEKPVKKIEDQLLMSSKAISGLGQWKTHLENVKDAISEFSSARLGSNSIFDRKKVVGEYDKYATIKATPGTTNQHIPFEIISLAEGQIIETNEKFKPDDKVGNKLTSLEASTEGKKEITFTISDNGLKSASVDKDFKVVEGMCASEGKDFKTAQEEMCANVDESSTVSEDAMFFPGKFTIGDSAEIEIKAGNTLEDIVKEINNITKRHGEAQNPHIIATVKKDSEDKKYIWIRSDEKHRGIQNKFEILKDGIKHPGFTPEPNNIKIKVDENTKVKDFVAQLRNSAKKADIEVIYNLQPNESGEKEGTISLKSLLTGTGNEIQMNNNFKSLFNIDIPQQSPKDAEIKVDGKIIHSKTNEIKTERLTIKLRDEPAKRELAKAKEKLAEAKGEAAEAEIAKAEAKEKVFNLSIENNAEGMVEKFKKLVKAYNDLSGFILVNSAQIEDPNIHSKPAAEAALYSYKEELNSINDQMFNLFNKLNQATGYKSKEAISDLGIGISIREDYTHDPTETKDGKEQIYRSTDYYEMVIDEDKLKNALEENFDKFKDAFSLKFDSMGNNNFLFYNNYKNFDFEANGVKNLDYNVDYSKIKYFSNISKPSPSADTKINEGLSEKSFFLIGNSKISIDKDTTYSSLVNEINKYSSQTSIKAYLLSGDRISSTNNPSGSKFEIALGLLDDKNIKPEKALESQNDLRSSLELFDPNNVLKGLFSSTAASLDIETKKDLIDNKIPRITLYDTSGVTTVKANLNDDSTEKLPSYLKLSDKNKLESGGVIKILPKTLNNKKKINLENFEVAYFEKDGGESTISANQGIADKISNLINDYTKFDGSIDRYTRSEERDKSYTHHALSYEKQAYQSQKAKIEKNSAQIQAQEIRSQSQKAFFGQLDNNRRSK